MTALYGVFGWPVAHSRSPAMHNAAFDALGLDALYVPFAVHPEQLRDAVEAVRTLEVRGLNVTLPLKADIMELLDEVEPDARAIGAVNTVLRDGARLIGTNTDAGGLTRSLQEGGVSLAGARVVLLGAGGAARAALVGLSRAGAERIVVAARRSAQAEALVRELGDFCRPCALSSCALEPQALAAEFPGASLLVQASSATLGDSAVARAFAATLPLAKLGDAAVVTDLVYKPLQTSVLAQASARGLVTLDGLGMLLHQGALAFERWTGSTAPVAAMRAALVA